jgi:HEAT repeat protein
MMRKLPGLGPGMRARVLTALSRRGDAAARPALMEAAKSGDAGVKLAALAGLGRIGDESSIAVLAEAAAGGQPAEQSAARQSLGELKGPSIDSAIAAAIGSATGKVTTELILAAGERRSTGAGDVLIRAALGEDAEARRAAVRALRSVAGPEQVPPLLDLVRKAAVAERREAAQTLAAALRRSQAKDVDSVISAYRSAAPDPVRVALLEALGQSGRGEALPVLRAALTDANAEIVRMAILGLTDWPDPAPLPDLLSVAAGASEPARKTLALRGYLKLVGLPSQRSNAETVKLLVEAVRLANDPAEKRSVLSLLAAHPCEEGLKLAESMAGDQGIGTEAKASADRIRAALKRR